jgi:hypothetical protein
MMKRISFAGLVLLAAAGVALAQQPLPHGTVVSAQPMSQPTAVTMQPAPGQPAPGQPVVGQPVGQPCAVECCPQSCGSPCTHGCLSGHGHHGDGTTCVAEPTVKKTNVVLYGTLCEPWCIKCGMFPSCFHHHDDCGSCGQCGTAITKHYLIKRVRVEECPDFKCVPVQSGCCAGGCAGGPVGGEMIPVPKK